MVAEFPELQGVMGREYARRDGHSEEVCLAIHEHYLPARAGDELPSSPAGAIVGLADRMDTVTGFFAIGMEPTGAADPFALRRHALAIIRILEKMEWEVSLREFILKALSILREGISFDEASVFEKVLDFTGSATADDARSDYSADLGRVISAEFDQLHHLRYRFGDLKKFVSGFSDLEPLALMFKRMVNILKNQAGAPSVHPALLKEPSELHLWKKYQGMKDEFHRLIEHKKYFEGLNLLVTLKEPVDKFFEGVEILTKKDEELKNNRVALLKELTQLFLSIADFSKFAI
jgi:glycyl-tRNA synthetase beta chain